MHAVRRGARQHLDDEEVKRDFWGNRIDNEKIFLEPMRFKEQEIVDAIIDTMFYEEKDRNRLRDDPLVRLLIPNPPGNYNVSVVTAMGVITEGDFKFSRPALSESLSTNNTCLALRLCIFKICSTYAPFLIIYVFFS